MWEAKLGFGSEYPIDWYVGVSEPIKDFPFDLDTRVASIFPDFPCYREWEDDFMLHRMSA